MPSILAPGIAQGALNSMQQTRQNAMDDSLLAERKQRMQAEALAIEQARQQQADALRQNQLAGQMFQGPPPVAQGMPPAPPMGQPGSGTMPIPQGGPPPGPMGSGTAMPPPQAAPQGGGPGGSPAMPPGMASQPQQAPQAPQKPPIPPYQTVQSAQRPPGGPPQAPQGPPPMPQQGQPQGAPPGGQPQGQGQTPYSPVDAIIKKMDEANVPLADRPAVFEKMKSFIGDKYKEQLETLKVQHEALQHELKQQQIENKRMADQATERHRQVLEQQGQQRIGMGQQRINITLGRDAAKAAGQTGGSAVDEKLAALSPAQEKEYRLQAWNYIDTKNLPYRKGSGGGADRNDLVMAMATKIGDELGMSPEQLAGKSATFKADASSFLNLTKKADVIEGQLESFHNNLQTWDNLAKGQGIKIGSAESKDVASKLGKIDFTGIKTVDEFKQKVSSQFNDPAVVAYVTAASAAAFDYARIMSSQGQSAGQITDSARAEAQRLVSGGFNNEARAALIATLDSDTKGQVKGLTDQKEKIHKRLTNSAEKSSASSSAGATRPAGMSDADWTAYQAYAASHGGK